MLDKRMDRQGLTITISAIGDALQILAALDGTATITTGRVVKVRPGVLADYQTQVRDLIAGSAAVDGIERMVHAVRNSGRAQASSVLASFALLRALRGTTPVTRCSRNVCRSAGTTDRSRRGADAKRLDGQRLLG